ncbi:glycosyltransferase family 4 protein [Deinococcus sp. UR1]|uniref:glycosyltransferase family 4 protein n=1 Tax=Deinococcus sp. UR1 TaxID=1704277 RepID=UPI0011AF37AA|nr:glycosyltransferase family 4 protein [Deinococcus sp. UR1]
MRILMVSVDFLPSIGGVAAHIYNLSKSLSMMGHHVDVLYTNLSNDDSVRDYQLDGFNVREIHIKPNRVKSLRIIHRNRIIKNNIEEMQELRGNYDIIHQHDFLSSTFPCRAFSKKWIWTNHTSGFLKTFDKFYGKMLIKVLYNKVRGIISVSTEINEKSKSIFKNTTCFEIPNGVNNVDFNPEIIGNKASFGLSGKDYIILCPRRMVEKNGIIYLAEAAKYIIENDLIPNAVFVFLGNDESQSIRSDYVDKIHNTLSALDENKRRKHIKFMGNLPMSEMPRINAMADIVVIPSLMEAVSLSALEAMASGTPVVASNVGGLPQIIHNGVTGFLVDSRSSESLVNALVQASRSDMSKIIENAINLVSEEYTWSVVAKRTLEIYKKVR